MPGGGPLRDDVDPDLAIDLLFGPLVFRLFNGRGPVGQDEADTLARLVLSTLSRS